MSVRYANGVSGTTRQNRNADRRLTDPSRASSKAGRKRSKKTNSSSKRSKAVSSKRTPVSSTPLFSVGDFSISNAEELKAVMTDSLQGFAVELGVQMAACLLEDDVVRLCGEKSSRIVERTAYRHGSQPGFVVLNGQKVAIRRPRVRGIDSEECELAVYTQLQSEDAMPAAALMKMVRGVSCRDYEAVVETARAGFGVKKSSVSRNFVAASSKQLEDFDHRCFEDVSFAAVFIDGVNFGGEMMVVAIGISDDGTKHVLGLRQGETENTEIVKSLLIVLRDRGVKTNQPTLFCVDGAKALQAGIRRVFGSSAVVQRCQIHKMRNVEAHLPKKHQQEARRRMKRAYAETKYEDAARHLKDTVAWLRTINRDAASCLLEGMEETLTVIKLDLTGHLKRIFSSTNVIESAFSRVRQITGRVKRWRNGNMRHRWCVAGLLRAEDGFRRIQDYKELPALIEALKAQVDNSKNSR